MHASLFSLVTTENPDRVFAWGMEITTAKNAEGLEASRKAIVYIHHSDDKNTLAQHTSAEAACSRWSQVVPLQIVWDSDSQAADYGPSRSSPITTAGPSE